MRRSILASLVIAAVACGGGAATNESDGGIDGGDPPGPDAGASAYPRPCGDLYADDRLPTFEIEIADSEWSGLVDEFNDWQTREMMGLELKPYHPLISFRYGDETVTDAMIRLKGNPCCSWYGPKMQFVISFNENDPQGRFHGLRKIALDAPPYDPSYLRNRLALAYLRDLGLPASCANNARLVVNGEVYGLYTSIEHMDREFLERNYAEPDGNLYKYGWELKTNEAIGDTTNRDLFWGTTDVATLESLADLDEVVSEWAAEAMIPHADGYFAGSGNFYMYDHPSRGFQFIPWDLDYTFDAAPVDADPITYRAPWGGPTPHFDAVLADPTWHAAYLDALARAVAAYDPPKLRAWIDAWSVQIAPAAQEDPNRPFSLDEHNWAVQSLRDYVGPRAQFVSDWLACVSGAGSDGDGDGFDWCYDCNDANPMQHPGAPEVCNGFDDDCNGVPDDSDMCPDCNDMDFGGERFSFCTRERTWFAAATHCTTLGGSLAVPVDDAEQTFLAGVTASLGVWGDEWWTGGNDLATEGVWQDTAGAALTYTPWAPGRPNGGIAENCVIIQNSLGGDWNDRDCSSPRPSICRLP